MEQNASNNSQPETEAEIHNAIERAEKYASRRLYRRLERQIPDLLELARSLTEQTGVDLLLPDGSSQVTVPNEPAILLNRLVTVFQDYFMVSGRRNLLAKLSKQAYLAACYADYENHWQDSARQAGTMVRLAYERLNSIMDWMEQRPEPPSVKELLTAWQSLGMINAETLTQMRLWFSRALKATQESGVASGAELLVLEALLAVGENNWTKARQLFRQSLEIYEAEANIAGQISTLIQLGNAEWQDGGGYKKAEEYYKLALTKAEQGAYDYYLAECCHKLGSIALHDEDCTLAQSRLERALQLCQHFRLRYLQAATLRELARTSQKQAEILRNSEQLPKAVATYERALNYASWALRIEKILKTWRKTATENLIVKLETEKAKLTHPQI